jgi:hypothetical protein
MNIKIIGCGWLGIQVGEHFSKLGNIVSGSFRSSHQKEVISKTNISGFELNLGLKTQISIDIFENTDIFIISLPPIKKEDPDYYAAVLAIFAQQISETSKIIFTSSIGIYPSREGRFTEDYSFNADEQNGLFKAESELRKILGDRLTILRLGGLIGPKRHPIKSLQGRTIPNDGSTPINLIHSTDICNAIHSIIDQNSFGMTYNLVSPLDVSKKIYYSSMIEKYNLEPIIFGNAKSIHRSIDGGLITKDLDFVYAFDPQNYNDILE